MSMAKSSRGRGPISSREKLERHIERIRTTQRASFDQHASQLEAAARASGIAEEDWERVTDGLLPFLQATDQIAVSAQKHTNLIDLLIGALSLGAVLLGALGLTFFPGSSALALLEATLALAAALLLTTHLRRRRHRLWGQSRYLAEHARIALFAHMAGVNMQSLVEESIAALPAEQDPKFWVGQMRDEILGAAWSEPSDFVTPARTRTAFVGEQWLKEQGEWHSKTGKRRGRHARALARTSSGILWCTIVVAVALAVAGYIGQAGATWFTNTATLLAIFLPAMSTSVLLFASQHELDRVASRSHRMGAFFVSLREELDAAHDDRERKAVLRSAARVACLENYEWSVLMDSAMQ